MSTRRDFIKTIFRSFAIIGIGIGSAFLIFRKKSDEVCNLEFVCGNCKKVKNCQLPEAKVYIKQKSHG